MAALFKSHDIQPVMDTVEISRSALIRSQRFAGVFDWNENNYQERRKLGHVVPRKDKNVYNLVSPKLLFSQKTAMNRPVV